MLFKRTANVGLRSGMFGKGVNSVSYLGCARNRLRNMYFRYPLEAINNSLSDQDQKGYYLIFVANQVLF